MQFLIVKRNSSSYKQMVYKFFQEKIPRLSSTFKYLNYNCRPLGLPSKRMTFWFLERFASLSSSFLRMLMISWVTAGPFRSVSLSLFISPLEFLSPICIFAPRKYEQSFGFFCNRSIVHHSPGLHAKNETSN